MKIGLNFQNLRKLQTFQYSFLYSHVSNFLNLNLWSFKNGVFRSKDIVLMSSKGSN